MLCRVVCSSSCAVALTSAGAGDDHVAYRVVELIRAQFPATAQVFIETVSGANETDESNEAMVMMVAGGEIIVHGLDCGVTAVNHVSKAAAVNGIVDAHAGRGAARWPITAAPRPFSRC